MTQSVATTVRESLGDDDVQAIDQLREVYARLRDELGRVIVGQHARRSSGCRSACSPEATRC